MSTSVAGTAPRDIEAEVCPSLEAALDVVSVKSERKIRKEAERDAGRLLKVTSRLGAPVDCAAIANEVGLKVFVVLMKEITLGGLLMKPGEQPKIYVNKRDGYLRQRLTCALELGHYLRRSSETNEYARVDRRGPRSKSNEGIDDIYAHEFAASLLMPKEDVEILAELGVDDMEMALRLIVPREAMQIRLKDLGLPGPDLGVG
jgi:Zn-dependent peptidase ImmA (M78 family)